MTARSSILALLILLSLLAACASEPEPSATVSPEPRPASSAAVEPAAPSAEPDVAADMQAVLRQFLAQLEAELQLPPEQAQTVRRILEDHTHAMSPHLEAIAAEPSRSAKLRVAQQHRDSMTQIRDATEQQLRSVLDEDQYARYVALRETFRRDLRETMQARYG